MVDDSPYLARLDGAIAALTQLARGQSISHEDRSVYREAIGALTLARAIAASVTTAVEVTPLLPATAPGSTAEARTPKPVMAPGNPYYGLGLGGACSRCLQRAGRPMMAREIWADLEAHGFRSAHEDPIGAVARVLPRRAKTNGDVILVGRGMWDWKPRLSDAQIQEITHNLGGMAGRDYAKHIEKTKEGMIVARERGAQIGQPKKLNADLVRQFKALMASGVGANKACKTLGFSYGTYRNYRAQIEAWSDGQPWPPVPASDDESEPDNGRVIN